MNGPDHVDETPTDGWLTELQAANRLGIGLSTLKQLVHDGKLPIVHRHRKGGIRVEDIDALLLGGRVQPGSMRRSYPNRYRHRVGET